MNLGKIDTLSLYIEEDYSPEIRIKVSNILLTVANCDIKVDLYIGKKFDIIKGWDMAIKIDDIMIVDYDTILPIINEYSRNYRLDQMFPERDDQEQEEDDDDHAFDYGEEKEEDGKETD